MCIRPLAIALMMMAGTSPLRAQDEPRLLCFHPRPLDRCRAFPVYELTVTATALSSSVRGGGKRDFPSALTGTAGAMVNVTQRLAVGAQFVHSPVQEFGNTKELRVRWWIADSRAVDASLGHGTSRHGEPPSGDPLFDGRTGGRGPSASLAFVPSEYLSFVARARRVRDDEGRQRRGLMVGVQTGSWSAMGITALAGGIVLGWFLLAVVASN